MEVVRNRLRTLRAWINEILQQLTPPNLNSDRQESFFTVLKVCITYNTAVRFDGLLGINGNIVNHLREVRDVRSPHTRRIFAGRNGASQGIFPCRVQAMKPVTGKIPLKCLHGGNGIVQGGLEPVYVLSGTQRQPSTVLPWACYFSTYFFEKFYQPLTCGGRDRVREACCLASAG